MYNDAGDFNFDETNLYILFVIPLTIIALIVYIGKWYINLFTVFQK